MKETYSIYHIFGEKIGCTHDLVKRVNIKQGCKPHEFEVLETFEDIIEASHRELELQKEYNYKIDGRLYCQNFKPMILNQRNPIHPNIGINKGLASKKELRNLLAKGVTFKTNLGIFTFDHDDVDELSKLAQRSKFDGSDYYFSIRALRNLSESIPASNDQIDLNSDTVSIDIDITNITAWAKNLGITGNSIESQTLKLGEEVGELQKAVLDQDDVGIRDGIGDIVVVLTSLAIINGTTLAQCIADVMKEINSRKAVTDDHGNVIATIDPSKLKNTQL